MKDKLKDYWENKPQKAAEKAFDKTINILMALEFLFVFGVYLALTSWVSQFCGNCWIAIAYALAMKKAVDYSAPSMKKEFMERLYGKEQENEERPKRKKDSKDSNE